MIQKMWIPVKMRREYLFFIVAALLTSIVGLATVATTDDHGNDYLTATYIFADGSLVQGEIEQPNDRDFFSFKASAKEKYLIWTGPLRDNMDTVIYLFEPDGQTVLEVNDNFDGGPRSRLLWSAPVDGMYFIMVRHTQADGIGHYALSLEVFRIQKMIERAGVGDTVLVPPGVYEENLVIEKSITLRGEGGSPEEIRIVRNESEQPVINIGSGEGEDFKVNVQNITVVNAQMDWTYSGIGIRIVGNAIVVIKDTKVTSLTNSSGEIGLYISGSAQVSLENCQISNQYTEGIAVKDSANVILNECHIYSITRNGITVSNAAQVTATHCELYSNNIAIVAGEGFPKLTLTNCEFYQNGIQADVLSVKDSTEMTIKECTFYQNYGSSIDVQGTARVVISDSKMTKTGISIGESAQATVTNCSIHGISIWGEASATIKDVQLSAGNIGVRGSSQVTVDDCTILKGSIRIDYSPQVTIRNSTISNSEDVGVSISGEATVTIANSTVSEHEKWGIYVGGQSQVTITGCTVSGNRNIGIMIYYSEPRVRILDSVISNNGLGIDATISNNIVECRGNTFVNNHDGNCDYAAAQKCQ